MLSSFSYLINILSNIQYFVNVLLGNVVVILLVNISELGMITTVDSFFSIRSLI